MQFFAQAGIDSACQNISISINSFRAAVVFFSWKVVIFTTRRNCVKESDPRTWKGGMWIRETKENRKEIRGTKFEKKESQTHLMPSIGEILTHTHATDSLWNICKNFHFYREKSGSAILCIWKLHKSDYIAICMKRISWKKWSVWCVSLLWAHLKWVRNDKINRIQFIQRNSNIGGWNEQKKWKSHSSHGIRFSIEKGVDISHTAYTHTHTHDTRTKNKATQLLVVGSKSTVQITNQMKKMQIELNFLAHSPMCSLRW